MKPRTRQPNRSMPICRPSYPNLSSACTSPPLSRSPPRPQWCKRGPPDPTSWTSRVRLGRPVTSRRPRAPQRRWPDVLYRQVAAESGVCGVCCLLFFFFFGWLFSGDATNIGHGSCNIVAPLHVLIIGWVHSSCIVFFFFWIFVLLVHNLYK